MLANFDIYGFSNQMGPELRKLVEQQLLADLYYYGVSEQNLRFDWSKSCIEGREATYLDGSLENFSGIALYDEENALVAERWMEFILEGHFFLVFWDFVTTWKNGSKLYDKEQPGIPPHIWHQLPESIHWLYEKNKVVATLRLP